MLKMPRGGKREGSGRKPDPNEGPRSFAVRCLTKRERDLLREYLEVLRSQKDDAKRDDSN